MAYEMKTYEKTAKEAQLTVHRQIRFQDVRQARSTRHLGLDIALCSSKFQDRFLLDLVLHSLDLSQDSTVWG